MIHSIRSHPLPAAHATGHEVLISLSYIFKKLFSMPAEEGSLCLSRFIVSIDKAPSLEIIARIIFQTESQLRDIRSRL